MHWERGTLHRVPIFFSFVFAFGGGCIPYTVWLEDGLSSDSAEDSETNIDSASDTSLDTAEVPSPCLPPIPGPFDLVTPVGSDSYPEFALTQEDWALGLVHANRQLTTLSETQGGPILSPSWFLAMSLSTTAMECETPGGCYGFSETNHWTLLCELYEELDCDDGSEMEAIIGASTADSSHAGAATLAMAWHAAIVYALLPKSGFDDPADWLSNASDPQALEKIIALGTIDSPWGTALQDVANGCQDLPIEDCIDEDRAWVRDQIVAIAAHIAELDEAIANGHCLTLSLSSDTVSDYGTQLSRLFPSLDWTEAIEAAVATSSSDGIALLDSADIVLDALDLHTGLELNCPEETLETLYETSCPQ